MVFWKSGAKPDAAALALLPFLDQLPELAMILEGGSRLAYLNASMIQAWPAGEQLLDTDFWESFPEFADDEPGRHCRAIMNDGQPRTIATLCLTTRKHHSMRGIRLGDFLILYGNEIGGADAAGASRETA